MRSIMRTSPSGGGGTSLSITGSLRSKCRIDASGSGSGDSDRELSLCRGDIGAFRLGAPGLGTPGTPGNEAGSERPSGNGLIRGSVVDGEPA